MRPCLLCGRENTAMICVSEAGTTDPETGWHVCGIHHELPCCPTCENAIFDSQDEDLAGRLIAAYRQHKDAS